MPDRKKKECLCDTTDKHDANLTNDDSMQMSIVQESSDESYLEKE